MQPSPVYFLLAALSLPALTACGAQNQDTPPTGSGAVDRIIAKETRNARKPDESRGLEIRRIGFEKVFAGTAIQYGATFKSENLIDLELSAHRLEGQQMLKSGARMENLPMAEGVVVIEPDQGDNTPRMTLTGVPGHESISMRMQQGTITLVSLEHEMESFTRIPVIKGFEVNFEGRFLGFSEDGSQIVAEPAGNRGVSISGAVRYHKE